MAHKKEKQKDNTPTVPEPAKQDSGLDDVVNAIESFSSTIPGGQDNIDPATQNLINDLQKQLTCFTLMGYDNEGKRIMLICKHNDQELDSLSHLLGHFFSSLRNSGFIPDDDADLS